MRTLHQQRVRSIETELKHSYTREQFAMGWLMYTLHQGHEQGTRKYQLVVPMPNPYHLVYAVVTVYPNAQWHEITIALEGFDALQDRRCTRHRGPYKLGRMRRQQDEILSHEKVAEYLFIQYDQIITYIARTGDAMSN